MLLCDALELVLTCVIVHGLNTFRLAQNISTCVIQVSWQNNRRDEQRGYTSIKPNLLCLSTVMLQPEVTLVGIVDVTGPGCTEAFRVALKAKFTQIMTELDALLGLCKTDSCDFKNGFSVTCDEGGRGRKKRDTSVVFHVVVNLDIAADRWGLSG